MQNCSLFGSGLYLKRMEWDLSWFKTNQPSKQNNSSNIELECWIKQFLWPKENSNQYWPHSHAKMVDAKTTGSYFIGPTYLSIIMYLSDIWWQYRSMINLSELCPAGGIKYVLKFLQPYTRIRYLSLTVKPLAFLLEPFLLFNIFYQFQLTMKNQPIMIW